MKQEKVIYEVRGHTFYGMPFTEELEFILLPPDEKLPHYGTGVYVYVKRAIGAGENYDMRYCGTSEITELAKIIINEIFGDRVERILRVIK